MEYICRQNNKTSKMKKILKSAIMIAASALLFVSCNEEDATPVASPSEFGTVRGFVFYDTDETDDDENIEIPVGAVVQITTFSEINNGEFDFTAGGDEEVSLTNVNADGSYSFTIPTNANGADYRIEVFGFDDEKSFERFFDGDLEDFTEEGVYVNGGTGSDGTGSDVTPSETETVDAIILNDFTSFTPNSLF